MRSTLSALALLLGAIGCAEPAEPATQVMLVIDAERGVREQIRGVQLDVTSGEGARSGWGVSYSGPVGKEGAQLSWPLEVALRPRDEEAEQDYAALVTALDADGETLAQVRAISGYLRGRSLRLPLYFDAACVARTELCDEMRTCVAGDCVDARIDPATLTPFTREPGQPVNVVPPRSDGGVESDAGPIPDAGADACTPGDTSCVPTIDCPDDRCAGCDPGFVKGAGGACEPLLSGLGLSAGALTPALDAVATRYTLEVPMFVQPLWITPVAAEGVEIRVDGELLSSEGARAIDHATLEDRTLVIELSHPEHGKRTYPVTLHRTGAEVAYLKASNTGAWDEFGTAVAIDGDTVVIGAPAEDSPSAEDGEDDSAEDSGAVYVFTRSGDSYTETARLKATSPELYARFGQALVLEGDTLAVGATGDGGDGAVYVFTRTGSGWSKPVRLEHPIPSQAREFGRAVALRGDRLAIGVPGDDENTFDGGAVYVFERSAGGDWGEGVRVEPEVPQLAGWFGSGVALDGERLAVGATGETSNDIGSGSAYVFEHDGAAFRQRARVVSSKAGQSDLFGDCLVLAGDRLAVGALLQSVSQPIAGAVTLFERTTGSWSETQQLAASNQNSYAYFGTRIAFDGELMITGAYEDDGGGSGIGAALSTTGLENSGTVYMFGRQGDRFAQLAAIKAAVPTPQAGFGAAVALSQGTLVVGAYYESSGARGVDGDANDVSAPGSGAAYVLR